MARSLRRWLAGPAERGARRPGSAEGAPSIARPLRRARAASVRAEALLRVFYVFPAFWFATHLDELSPLLDPRETALVWPVAWLELVGVHRFSPVVFAFGLGTALLGVLAPQLRVVRVAVLVGLLEVLALKYSFGKIHHLMHGWLYASFIFAFFLPNAAFAPERASRVERQSGLLAIQAAQAMVALTYSLAGLGKLLGAVYQAALGQITPLHPSALALHIADRLLQTHPESVLGPFMIDHALALWPMMLATLYLQLFAFVAAFRPRLHRLWGFGLIGFHVVTALSMTIDFSPNILLLGLLFLASPTAPRERPTVQDLPGVGGVGLAVLRRFSRR